MKSLRCFRTSLSQQCPLSWVCKAAVLGQFSVAVVSNEEPQMSPYISITTMISILDVIIKYYEDFNLLSDRQHGFRRSKSTITALTEIIKIALEHKTREYAAIIAVDISAAFDNAWWPALMKRLDEDGVQASMIKLLQSYFDNRRIRFRYSSTEINKKLRYADDITLICWNKSPEQLRKTIDNVLRKINKWCESRKLKLSDEKTKILYLYKCNSDIIVSGSKLIKPVEELKILGVTIKNHRVRSKLDFTPHVNEMIIKVTRASGYLFGLTKKAWGLDFRRRLILYKTLYRSTITYGYPIWYPFINKKSKDKLNSLQYSILKHCIQAYSTTSSDCTHILAQVPKLTEYIESNMLKTEINYNRFDSSSRNIISNYIREKLQKYYEKTNTIFKSFFTDSQIPKYVKPNFYNVQFFTGHGNFRSYLYKVRKTDSPKCSCGAEEENPVHILTDCRLVEDLRVKNQININCLNQIVNNRYMYINFNRFCRMFFSNR
ncbi:hypothetical protein LAZ67_3003522 [Cordylochernes scorpioides]|uniref:Reverse transcriptase domain-containing protein n=1 Tax=Cordylochernes scorpioides TaxID=51811 RepID=A0ABY6KAC3_9ARAC|nr:hypothetical protein LAZ67_3003522 [Cordylochernes scorpioides]